MPMMGAGSIGSVPQTVLAQGDRRKLLRRLQLSDRGFHVITQLAAAAVLVILGGVILSLVLGSLPAIREFGFSFLTSQSWNPVTDKFGALPAIYGTLITSLLAMIIAIPVGIGIAIFLTELCPPSLRRPIGIAIELLAGIPSIIYGIWGLFILAPFVQQFVEPALIAIFGPIPVLSTLFAGPPMASGFSLRASSSPSWCCRSSPRSRAMCLRPCRPC